MDAIEQLQDDLREGRIAPLRLIELLLASQRQLQDAHRRIAELEKELGGSATTTVDEPFSLRAEEKRQEARDPNKRKAPRKGRRGRFCALRGPSSFYRRPHQETTMWFRALFHSLKPRPSGARVRPSSGRSFSRLRVEALEDRVVPALHTWTGAVNDLWSEPGNWDGGVPTSNEAGGTRVSFQGNTASVVDIAELQVDLLELDGTNNALTLSNPLIFNDIVTRGGAHAITGEPIFFVPNIAVGDSIVQVNVGSTLLIDSPLSGFLTLRKTGDGSLSLRDGPDSSGTIFVEEGTLEVPTDCFLNCAVLVNGGRLTGGGTVVTVTGDDSLGNGLLAPGGGVSIQTLTVGTGDFGDLTYQPALAGANSDRINLIGLLDLTGTALSVQILQPPTAASYTLIHNSGTDPITGTFTGAPEGTAVFLGRQAYTISYVGGDGNDVVLIRAGEPPTPPASPPVPPLSAQSPPALSGAQVVGRLLVLSGASVPNGIQFTPVPLGSTALFTDLNGDGNGDVVLLVPNMTLVIDGRTGRLLALDADDNGDGVRDLQIFNPDGTTTRIDGRVGPAPVL